MISHSSDFASEYLKDSRYWLQVIQKYHIVSLLNAQRTHWIWGPMHNMNRAYGPSQSDFYDIEFFFPSSVFYLTKAFLARFSSIALWALNPSCGNRGFCCISQFITHGKLWCGTPPTHTHTHTHIISLCSYHLWAQGSENRWRYSGGLLGRSVSF